MIRVFILGLILSSHVFSQEFEMGILIQPIKEGKLTKFKAGTVIEFRESKTKKYFYDIKCNDSIYTAKFSSSFIPYDKGFSPARTYLILQEKNYGNYVDMIVIKHDLSKSIIDLFPGHKLIEEIEAQYCIYSKICREYPDGVKGSYEEEIELFEDFLLKYPTSKYRDEFEWKIIQMRNNMYEFEGDASGPLSQARSYEKFLSEHPYTKMSNVIKDKCAELYRVAYECIVELPEDNAEFTEKDSREFQLQAIKYYKELLSSNDPKLMAKAEVSLFNINLGKNIYIGHGW